ncbi:MAG: GNAT family N-acetyltransferase [Clostridiales bacterium]|jgi:GNAT superfamily N-acetyltransferase|nr:GNAT family N-acetyltransferase [Clostridiales bacterium]
MQIVDFTAAHIEQAGQIAKQSYDEERGYVPALPPVVSVPDLMTSAEDGLGVVAFEGDTMLGFLCSVKPFQNAFGSTEAIGVFSPLGANGAIGHDRAKIYARLYQVAGEKWVRAGASSHAICLYAHDKETQEQFFRYGFGLRCIDAIRGVDEIAAPLCDGYTFSELASERYSEVYRLDMMLHRHCLESPFFMVKPCITETEFLESLGDDRFFVARKDNETVAFLCASQAGETFLRDIPGYIHAHGAYCLPEHRGKGLLQGLLRLAVATLRDDGYKHLGVDFESINPPAYAFWLKYFDAYTHSVVRRIDEGALMKR